MQIHQKLYQKKPIPKTPKNYLNSYKFGQYSEKFVMIFLWLKGYKILKNRFKSYLGEIDIIAFKKNQIIFIEVKARKYKTNQEKILSNSQILRIKKSAEFFISKNSNLKKYKWRFDFIEVAPMFLFFLKIKHRINFIS
jgi:putative endonuclease